MFEKLFSNSGKKLHIVANVIFCLYVIAGGIVGYFFAFVDDDVFIFFPLGIAVGFGVGWLSTLMIHVFADIAENSDSINRKINNHEN